MRALVPLALVLTAGTACAADAPDAAPHPLQIRVRLETAHLAPGALAALGAVLKSVPGEGDLTVTQAARFRTNFAALVASGRVSVTDSLAITVLDGTTARIGPGPRFRAAALRASNTPTYRDGRVTARLDLSVGSPNAAPCPAQTLQREVTSAEDELVVVRFPGTGDRAGGPLLIVRFDRVP